jgi:hypothetical protein
LDYKHSERSEEGAQKNTHPSGCVFMVISAFFNAANRALGLASGHKPHPLHKLF